MEVFYDLHIHSCLSPCADEDMTPNNIVNMALLADLNMIAITDHNSCKNCPAFFKVAEAAGLTPVAGMELTTSEECHVVCLFETLEQAMAFDHFVETQMYPIKNKPEVYGCQQIRNELDEITGEFPYLLVNATQISLDDIDEIVGAYGGVAIPAHVNRASNSVISVLGVVPEGFKAYEVSWISNYDETIENNPVLKTVPNLTNSDAHFLHLIQEAGPTLDLKENSAAALIEYFRHYK